MNRLNDEWFSSKSESVPLWHKIALSIDEMYVYTGIGRETIRELTKQPEAKQFTLKIGKRTLIKRKQFEEYLDQMPMQESRNRRKRRHRSRTEHRKCRSFP